MKRCKASWGLWFGKIKLPCIIFVLILAGGMGAAYLAGPGREPPRTAATPPWDQPQGPFLQSFFQNRAAYEDAFAAAGSPPKVRIQAGVVSHHLLARNLIASFFAGIDPQGVERVILVAPDHYRRLAGRQELFYTTLLPWETPYGFLEADASFLQGWLADGRGARHDGAFRQEHGVWVLAPFIKRTFPQARLAPFILRGSRDYAEFYRWGERLGQASRERTVFLVSCDFAHGVDAAAARRLDRVSLSCLTHLSLKNLGDIQADARPGLAALAGFLGSGPRDFVLVSHRTSADFGSRDAGNLTSYIAAYYRGPPPPTFSILFLGDLMFDRAIRKIAAEKGLDYPFLGVADLLRGHRLVVANLEGPITDQPSVSLGRHPGERNHYVFTFPPALADTLREHGINLLHLGNNHLLDFGPAGAAQTRQYLEQAGLDFFGDPLAGEGYALQEIDRVRLAFVSHNQFAGRSVEKTLEAIKGARPRVHLVIVYAHWGGEYRREPGERLRRLGRLFIDAGADLIVGSHSHTVQPREAYRGKMIYYSLGNFIFDQSGREETRRGLALKVKVNPADLALDFEEIPLYLEKNGQTIYKGK